MINTRFWKPIIYIALSTILLSSCTAEFSDTHTPEQTPPPELPTSTPTPELPTSTPSPELPTSTPSPAPPASTSTDELPTSTSTPDKAVPESCEAVDAYCLELAFEGDSCIYKGPTEIDAGLVELIFNNNSDDYAAVNFLVLLDDKTIDDVIEYIGEEPSTNHHPSWSQELGTWRPVPAGGSQRWRSNLDPGNYSIVCARLKPLGVWHGTGLIVEE